MGSGPGGQADLGESSVPLSRVSPFQSGGPCFSLEGQREGSPTESAKKGLGVKETFQGVGLGGAKNLPWECGRQLAGEVKGLAGGLKGLDDT